MNIKKLKCKRVSSLFIALSVLLANTSIASTTIAATATTEQTAESNVNEPKLIKFDLGKSPIPQSFISNATYDMQGEIAIPAGNGKHPVVFVLHGCHEITALDKERYDLGFSYLLKDLAKNGYMAISINVNAQYTDLYGEASGYGRLNIIFNEHLEKLTKAVNGENSSYGVNLKGRADLSKIILIGHSRSGQGIYSIAQDQKLKDRNNIAGLLLVAPCNFLVLDYPYLDVPTGIIMPQLDGDVSELDGQAFYNDLQKDKNHKSWTSMAYLYGANHNFFNTQLTTNDSLSVKDRIGTQKPLTAVQQRTFLSKYSIDFINSIFSKKVEGKGFKSSDIAPSELYGFKVLTSLNVPSKKVILDMQSNKNIARNNLGGELKTTNAKVKAVCDSFFYKEDSAGAFRLPGNSSMKLLNVTWNKSNASLSTKLSNRTSLAGYKSISLYMAVDSPNPLNKKNVNQAITLMLKNKTGKCSSIVLDAKTPALSYQPGKVLPNEYSPYWSTHTPLSSVRVPLSSFKNINLNNVDSISLVFNKTQSGSLMISEISFLK